VKRSAVRRERRNTIAAPVTLFQTTDDAFSQSMFSRQSATMAAMSSSEAAPLADTTSAEAPPTAGVGVVSAAADVVTSSVVSLAADTSATADVTAVAEEGANALPAAEVIGAVAGVAAVDVSAGASDEGASDEGASDEGFYASLNEIIEFREAMSIERHALAPASALLVSTAVIESTKAIEAGRYRDVNALGVASIVAVCNAMRDVELPYVFGGDGATLLVPGSRRQAAEQALRGVRALARSAFDLDLRASIVPVAELVEAGHVARVARFRASEHARLALFSGSAFATAGAWLEDGERGARYEVSREGESAADFAGFECRWQPLGSQRGHSVSLLVRALAPTEAERAQTYRNLLHAFERIVDTDACHPIKLSELKLNGMLGDYSVEARVRAQGASGSAYAAAHRSARKQSFLGKLLAASGMSSSGFDGKRYKQELIDNADYRRFDDTLRMVVDLNVAEIYRLESRLAAEHRAGRLVYGLHRSGAALVTCFVRSYNGDHVHFVDGAEGGYALAAQELRSQLAELVARGAKGVNGLRLERKR
jgi:hypothetical protein